MFIIRQTNQWRVLGAPSAGIRRREDHAAVRRAVSRQKYLAKLSIKSPVADLWLVYKCALVAVLEL